jgi:hypothetical protein
VAQRFSFQLMRPVESKVVIALIQPRDGVIMRLRLVSSHSDCRSPQGGELRRGEGD